QFRADGSDGVISDPAGDDRLEVGEIRTDVEGEAVGSDPAGRNPDSDRRELSVVDPDAGEALDAASLYSQIEKSEDQDLLEIAEIPVEVASLHWKLQDGVADQLARSVVGDIATAPDAVDLDPATGKLGW